MTDEDSSRTLPGGRGEQVRARRSEAGAAIASGAASSRQRRRAAGSTRHPRPPDSEIAGETVPIELSKAQVDQVVRTAGRGGAIAFLLASIQDPHSAGPFDPELAYPVQLEDRRLSRSLLSGLMVLACFPADGGYLGIAELARMLDMNTSTTHRYVSTLLAVGLLQRDSASRRYRLAPG